MELLPGQGPQLSKFREDAGGWQQCGEEVIGLVRDSMVGPEEEDDGDAGIQSSRGGGHVFNRSQVQA